jgi:hypothetical protein
MLLTQTAAETRYHCPQLDAPQCLPVSLCAPPVQAYRVQVWCSNTAECQTSKSCSATHTLAALAHALTGAEAAEGLVVPQAARRRALAGVPHRVARHGGWAGADAVSTDAVASLWRQAAVGVTLPSGAGVVNCTTGELHDMLVTLLTSMLVPIMIYLSPCTAAYKAWTSDNKAADIRQIIAMVAAHPLRLPIMLGRTHAS